VTNNDFIYDPQGMGGFCQDVIQAKGGWDNLTASDAQSLAQIGCFPAMPSVQIGSGIPIWSDPGGALDPGQTYDLSRPEDPFPFEHPIIVDVVGEEDKPVLTGPDNDSGGADGLLGALVGAIPSIVTGFTSQIGPNPLEPAGEAIGGIIARAIQGTPSFGVQALPEGSACWLRPRKNGMINRRARVRLRRQPDGSTVVEKYCAPRRMNPLNARALGRAARRLGMFHNIAAHIEKTVQKACRSGIGRRRLSAPRFGGSCGPKKRCR